jgi:hypothetical protein
LFVATVHDDCLLKKFVAVSGGEAVWLTLTETSTAVLLFVTCYNIRSKVAWRLHGHKTNNNSSINSSMIVQMLMRRSLQDITPSMKLGAALMQKTQLLATKEALVLLGMILHLRVIVFKLKYF